MEIPGFVYDAVRDRYFPKDAAAPNDLANSKTSDPADTYAIESSETMFSVERERRKGKGFQNSFADDPCHDWAFPVGQRCSDGVVPVMSTMPRSANTYRSRVYDVVRRMWNPYVVRRNSSRDEPPVDSCSIVRVGKTADGDLSLLVGRPGCVRYDVLTCCEEEHNRLGLLTRSRHTTVYAPQTRTCQQRFPVATAMDDGATGSICCFCTAALFGVATSRSPWVSVPLKPNQQPSAGLELKAVDLVGEKAVLVGPGIYWVDISQVTGDLCVPLQEAVARSPLTCVAVEQSQRNVVVAGDKKGDLTLWDIRCGDRPRMCVLNQRGNRIAVAQTCFLKESSVLMSTVDSCLDLLDIRCGVHCTVLTCSSSTKTAGGNSTFIRGNFCVSPDTTATVAVLQGASELNIYDMGMYPGACLGTYNFREISQREGSWGAPFSIPSWDTGRTYFPCDSIDQTVERNVSFRDVVACIASRRTLQNVSLQWSFGSVTDASFVFWGDGFPARSTDSVFLPSPLSYNSRRALTLSAPRFQIYESILETIGRTPVVNARANGVTLYTKLEFFNPTSSVKDRLAIAIIDAAEASGQLKPGMTVVEATSGNTGVALAMVCAKRDYPFVAVMGEQYSIERRRVMRALGAKVVLTPKALSGTGMVQKAQELAQTHGWFLARQFENEANSAYHANTTGPEILRDFAGRRLDYWVTGYGTGGTFAGAAKIIKCARPDVRVALVEPSVAALVSSKLPQERHGDGSPAAGHPAFASHAIQGWTPNFIPAVCDEGLRQHLYDTVLTVTDGEALDMARSLSTKEGIFAGISAGATTAAAVKIAEDAQPGSVILAMLPDTQERYQTTALFDTIATDMNDEELQISKSTPSCQL